MMMSQSQLLNRPFRLTRFSPATQHHCTHFSSARTFQKDRPSAIRSHVNNNSNTEGSMRAVKSDRSSALQGGATEERAVAPPQKDNQLRKFFEAAARCAAVGGLCLAMVLTSVNPALAARSGGYMGGSNFSSRSSIGSGMGGSSLRGSLGSSSKFGGASSYTNSFSYRGSSAPGLTLRRGPSVSAFFGPPVFYGGGYGYGYGAPVAGGGGSLGTILVLGVLAAVVWTMFSSSGSSGYDDGYDVVGDERVTVCKLQVGLLGTARQLQRDLERIADRADTDSPSGLHYILQETVLSLLRNPDYCIYGASFVNNKRGLEAGESRFNELSMEERSKFKQETLVNVGGRRKSGTYSGGGVSQGVPNELIVVTILVAIEGGLQLPNVTSLEDLRTVLNKLGSIGQDQTLAVEVLWTPQDEGDYYTRDEIFQDYPTLNNL